MDKNSIIKSLKEARENAKKRNFSQTVELIINFKGLDLKKPEQQLDFYSILKHPFKPAKICGLVGEELLENSKKTFDETIFIDDFDKYNGKKKEIKALARKYDYFVAQANLMPKVATVFGRFFGPLGKMPNPKAGCVVPPAANLEVIKGKLSKQISIKVKSIPVLQIPIGKEDGKDEEIAEDIYSIYDQIIHKLPGEVQNIKSIYIKLTMGKPVKVE